MPKKKILKKKTGKSRKTKTKKTKKTVRRNARPSARKVAHKVARKTAKRGAKAGAKKPAQRIQDKPVGKVTHFYNHIGVAIVKFSKPVKAGSVLAYRGATTDFKEVCGSMQFDHKPIAVAPKGKQIGIKVKSRVREGDEVYLG